MDEMVVASDLQDAWPDGSPGIIVLVQSTEFDLITDKDLLIENTDACQWLTVGIHAENRTAGKGIDPRKGIGSGARVVHDPDGAPS